VSETHIMRRIHRIAGLAVVLLGLLSTISSQTLPLPANSPEAASSERHVRIGVLGLFHAKEFRVSPTQGQTLVLQGNGETALLETSSGLASTKIQLSDARAVATIGSRVVSAPKVYVAGRNGEAVDFTLAIPNKITRLYHGTLEIEPSGGALIAIVTMDEETAVASVVSAESAPDTPIEALKAQAIATRSYFEAGKGRHREFDFCDTTHCQFLRNPPAKNSVVDRAVKATQGLVLAYNSHPFSAMYTRTCSGRTRTPAELGMEVSTYPYYPVECEYCRSHPARWKSRISASDAALLHHDNERARLAIDRRLGWSAIPSNDFVMKKDGDQVVLTGVGSGHGIGLCQAGAKAMAETGATYQEILSHYYPNSTIVRPYATALAEQSEEAITPHDR